MTQSNTLQHGHARRGNHSGAYKSWANMRKRCSTPSHHAYPYYGGRGIKICERWGSFSLFFEDMGNRPDKMEIDRINSDGDYEPGNCRWATKDEQAENRRGVHHLTVDGETKSIREWAAHTGLPTGTIYQRLKKGASHKDAVTRPWYSRSHQSAESRSRKRKTAECSVHWVSSAP